MPPRKKQTRTKKKVIRGGGQKEHQAAQNQIAMQYWPAVAAHLEPLGDETIKKVKDVFYRGIWDWISDH